MSKNTAVIETETKEYRLPRTVVPSKYEISLAPDLTNFKFAGEEVVHVQVLEPVKEILMNAIELEVHEVQIENEKGTKYSAAIALHEKTERLVLTFEQGLEQGKYKLHIKFTGTLNDKLRGFYRSTYKDLQGNQKVIATTQFEATDARRAFPCWDEPDFKAVYAVKLTVDEALQANDYVRQVRTLMTACPLNC